MREIKFRAWLKDKQVMKKIRSIEWAGIAVSSGFIKHIDTVNDRYYSKDYNDKGNYILMQYTGLKDANGKEIYEGDVVADQYGYRFEIVFRDGCWFAGNSEVGFSPKDTWNVIGNIYENPELLN